MAAASPEGSSSGEEAAAAGPSCDPSLAARIESWAGGVRLPRSRPGPRSVGTSTPSSAPTAASPRSSRSGGAPPAGAAAAAGADRPDGAAAAAAGASDARSTTSSWRRRLRRVVERCAVLAAVAGTAPARETYAGALSDLARSAPTPADAAAAAAALRVVLADPAAAAPPSSKRRRLAGPESTEPSQGTQPSAGATLCSCSVPPSLPGTAAEPSQALIPVPGAAAEAAPSDTGSVADSLDGRGSDGCAK
eukprot:TRINITY_DN9229_c2_g4_i1.p2 TRINITY_DN9229_c2_g4~~TRINITY_DN9229_c2_g4_i1.p2  ORF type:complete len:249 (+),score=62.50 TRINITY_DN9229_c2_g4_i1:82-828(+)